MTALARAWRRVAAVFRPAPERPGRHACDTPTTVIPVVKR